MNAEPAGFSPQARAILEEIGEVVEEEVPVGELALRVAGFDALIVRLGHRVDEPVLAAGRRLDAVVTATTGLDHIDLEAALRRRVEVLSLKGESDFLRTIRATGEHTWALLLALVRRVPWAFDDVLHGRWCRDRFRGSELAGRRLGILGLGRVGRQVAGYGRAFGMKTGAFDPFAAEWVVGVKRFPTLETLLRWSEILSVHLPLGEATRGILGRRQLELLPRGALVVNTARGALLDERPLVDLLEEGHLGGAAVDVLAHEDSKEDRGRNAIVHYARRNENLLVTPHLGGATWESMHRTEVFMAEKLRSFWRGEPR